MSKLHAYKYTYTHKVYLPLHKCSQRLFKCAQKQSKLLAVQRAQTSSGTQRLMTEEENII